MTDWQSVRSEFPALQQWTYLNSATFGQCPSRARDAMNAHMTRRDAQACSDFLNWFSDADGIRESCAKLIHCQPEDIGFAHSACAALAWLMNGLDWRAGDEVLTLEGEFPNNIYPQPLLQAAGVVFRQVPWEKFYDAVTNRTRLVLLSVLNYATGFRPPLVQVSEFLASRGVMLYLDGTQGAGVVHLDVSAIRPVMLAVDAYKWMLSPNGAGFVYVSPELRKTLLPTIIGWRSDRDWRNVNQLNHGNPVFADSAERYEGGQIVFPSLYAMGAVVDWMVSIGPEQIEQRALQLAGYARTRLSAKGADVSPSGSPIITAKFADRDSGALAKALSEKRILVSARHGRLRVSTHFYNLEEDVDRLAEAL